ncbi:beta strand repeat-containing protein [Actinosynnema sp. CA-248983]
MQTWAKRGFQTALVTGGLLMLGTGIASAQENVNPDAKPSPLDARVRVPIDVEENNLGTPVGNRDLPEIHREIGTENVPQPEAVTKNPLVRDAVGRAHQVDTTQVTRGNAFDGDVVAPVHACGNAVGAGGDAHADGECAQYTPSTGKTRTDGSRGSLAGNVAAVHNASPIGATGNAAAIGANAYSESYARQDAAAGGDVSTGGSDGSLSGNILGVQQATPFRVSNNAVAGGGIANSASHADTEAEAGGSLATHGDRSTLGGNTAGVPLAPITSVEGNALGAAGNADSTADHRTTAVAGDTGPTRSSHESWLSTSGENATMAGNALQPQLAGPATVNNNALAGVGNADTETRSDNNAQAGGWAQTSGQDSTLSGNFGDAPVALPVGSAGNSGSVLGNTSSTHAADTDVQAGGSTFTDGDRSVLSANSTNVAPAGAIDACGNGLSGGGIATSQCENEVDSSAGGYNGTTGNDAVLSGNIGQAPLALPAEGFGNAGGVGGLATGNAVEDKEIRAGGAPNARDDNGTVSSNVVTTPTALGGQGFGNAGGLVANPNSKTDSDTAIVAGGPASATGRHGSMSGNIVEAPTSNPAQVPGNTVVAVGNGASDLSNELHSRSGGNATSEGDHGAFTGNIVSAPQASSPQVFGSTLAAGSNAKSAVENEFTSFSGGDIETSGNQGSVSGNGLTAQPAVALQTFADSVSAAGNSRSDVTDQSAVVAGGDQETEAWNSSLSGNLVNLPANAKPGVFGDAVTAGGLSDANADSLSLTQSGGDSETKGSGALTSHDVSVPAETRPAVFDVPADVLGDARTDLSEASVERTGDEPESQGGPRKTVPRGINLPAGVDSLMKPTELPSLSSLDKLSGLGAMDLSDLRDFDLSVLRGLELSKVRELGAPQVRGMDLTRASDLSLTRKALPTLPAVSDLVDLEDMPVNQIPNPKLVLELLTGQAGGLPKVDLTKLAPGELPTKLPSKAPATSVADKKLPAPALPGKLPTRGLTDVKVPGVANLPGLNNLSKVTGLTKSPELGRLNELRRLQELRRVPEAVVNASDRHKIVNDGDKDERSFGGTLPLFGGTLGVTPVVQGLPLLPGPQKGSPRSLPSLASPLPLPFVVPVPGVAQPRTAAPALPGVPAAPAVPQLSGASLSGLNVNPLNGQVEGPKERTSAPALAGLDAMSIFDAMGAMDVTQVMPKL